MMVLNEELSAKTLAEGGEVVVRILLLDLYLNFHLVLDAIIIAFIFWKNVNKNYS